MNHPVSLIIENIISHEYTHYVFRDGLPTVIVGRNADNPSQKGNGSGKSALNESIVLTITGDSIRNISKKKIVRRGCEFGTTEMQFHNSMNGTTLRVWRKFYSGGKSSEVKVWHCGDPVELAEVDDYAKYIFNYFGISKEDFFSFYVLANGYYKPFLLVGDTGKKEIINRFSGAEKIDNVTPEIDKDVKVKENNIKLIESLVYANKGKQDVISDQIVAEELAFSPEAQRKLRELKTHELHLILEQAEGYDSHLDVLKGDLQAGQEELALFLTKKVDYDTDIQLREEELKKVKENIVATQRKIPAVKDQFVTEVNDIKERELKCDQELVSYKAQQKEAQEIEAELEGMLAGTITCPKCTHNFLLADEGFDVEAGKRNLREVKDILETLKADLELATLDKNRIQLQKEKINEKVTQAQQQLRIDLEGYNKEAIDLGQKITGAQELKRRQAFSEQMINDKITKSTRGIFLTEQEQEEIVTKAESKQKEVDEMKDEESEQLEALQTKLLEYMDEGTELEEKVNAAKLDLQLTEQWYVNFKNFKSFLANQSIKNIQDYTNLYLQQMGTDLSILVEGYKTDSKKKLKEQITVTVQRDGIPEDEYGTYSGGERGRIDVCVILAIQTLINLNSPSGGLDLLIADEIFDSIDSLGLECIIQGLENTKRTVIFVSQVEINSLQQHMLIIQKKNKISSIL